MNFLDKLDYLMEKHSLNKRKLSVLSGVPYTTIDGFYKKGYENTKLSTARKIASTFHVSLDYLLDDDIQDETYGIVPKSVPSAPIPESNEERFVALYRELNSEGQEKLLGYADDLLSSKKYQR